MCHHIQYRCGKLMKLNWQQFETGIGNLILMKWYTWAYHVLEFLILRLTMIVCKSLYWNHTSLSYLRSANGSRSRWFEFGDKERRPVPTSNRYTTFNWPICRIIWRNMLGAGKKCIFLDDKFITQDRFVTCTTLTNIIYGN